MNRNFFRAVLPSMLAFAFSGVYAIVDGLFVGRSIGDLGLAAINLAYPVTAFIQAVGTGLGMGGAIQIAFALGREDDGAQRRFLGNTLLALGLACAVCTALLCAGLVPILRLFGAEGELLTLSAEYGRIIVLGASLQLLSTGLIPVLRNYDGAILAMFSMIAGFFFNVGLDYLFVMVLGWGMTGAALATLAGQAVTVVVSLLCLMKKGKLREAARARPCTAAFRRILTTGVSPFGLTLSPNLVIIVLNRSAIAYGGDRAVACYAVISYIVCVAQLLLQGIGDGSQPLFSRCHGAGEFGQVHGYRRRAYWFSFGVALFCMGLLFALRVGLPTWFGASPQAVGDVAAALPIFLAGLLFAAFLRVSTSYFYAVGDLLPAGVLIYGEPLLLLLLLTVGPPRLWGVNGVWLCVPLTQGLLSLAGALLLFRRTAAMGRP